jgi:hypothetical protein
MLEMHHKQAEIVVSRVLSEKLLLKNKTLANEYKKLKVFKSAPSLTQAFFFAGPTTLFKSLDKSRASSQHTFFICLAARMQLLCFAG